MNQKMSYERYQKIRSVLSLRQPDLTVCMEEVHKPHNVSAVIRSCDAVGVHKIHAVWEKNESLRKGTSMGSQIWVKTQHHQTIEDAAAHLKAQNMQVLVTHLDEHAIDFREVDYTKPTAIILGQEKSGATPQAIASADQAVVIPMVGMVQSLNVSVAAAILMYEAQRQREAAGMYKVQNLDESECQKVLFEGGFPALYEICVRRKLSFPYINERGEIEASADWWDSLKYS
jgi:tRNA (guanosine-2'-O-)-methyltransferase